MFGGKLVVVRHGQGVMVTGADLARDCGRRPAVFRHDLHESPLFALDSLVDAAGRSAPGAVEVRGGDCAPRLVAGIDEHPAWVVLKDVQADPELGPAVAALLDQMAALARQQRDGAVERAHLFIASAHVETPLHADDDQGFLVHIRGGKRLTLFDMGGRHFSSVLARRTARSDRVFSLPERWPAAAVDVVLAPGEGVHIPWQWPHRAASTGPGHSVSLNVSFETRETERRARAAQFNDALVRLGLKPRAVGGVPALDFAKAAAAGGVAALGRVARRAPGS